MSQPTIDRVSLAERHPQVQAFYERIQVKAALFQALHEALTRMDGGSRAETVRIYDYVLTVVRED